MWATYVEILILNLRIQNISEDGEKLVLKSFLLNYEKRSSCMYFYGMFTAQRGRQYIQTLVHSADLSYSPLRAELVAFVIAVTRFINATAILR